MSDRPIFSRKLLLGFVAAAIAAFALSLYLMSRSDYGADRLGPSSYSSSAIGYSGLAATLEKLGIPIKQSRYSSTLDADEGILILAEPQLALLPQTTIPVLPDADRILLVLPKWYGTPGGEKSGWLKRVTPLPLFVAERTLRIAQEKPDVEREENIESWTVNTIGATPPSAKRVQLIKSETMTPLIASKKGILLGEVLKGGRRVWVLADPDMIANNAFTEDGKGIQFAVTLIEKFRSGTGTVVFDETVHGFTSQTASAAQLLFKFPYSMVTLQAVIGLMLALWATMGRFGPPDTMPPTLVAGKAGLITNVAHLMEFAGHDRLIIRRYVEATLQDTASQLRAPKDIPQSELVEWLRRVGKARNVSQDGTEILQRADRLIARSGTTDLSQFAELARDIHRWKQEILHGAAKDMRKV